MSFFKFPIYANGNMERAFSLPGLAMLVRLATALGCRIIERVAVLDREPKSRKR